MLHYVTTVFEDGIIEHALPTEEAALAKYREAKERYPGDLTVLCPKADITDRNITLSVTRHELDVMIASLRLWQRQDTLPTDVIEIAENGRGHAGFPSDEEIDELIEDVLNSGAPGFAGQPEIFVTEMAELMNGDCTALDGIDLTIPTKRCFFDVEVRIDKPEGGIAVLWEKNDLDREEDRDAALHEAKRLYPNAEVTHV